MYIPKTKEEKLVKLKEDLVKYEAKLAGKMKNYRGVSHENALAELKHAEVTVLQAMVADLKREIIQLEEELRKIIII